MKARKLRIRLAMFRMKILSMKEMKSYHAPIVCGPELKCGVYGYIRVFQGYICERFMIRGAGVDYLLNK